MLHLIIHHWITEYKISHWQKEKVVDLLLTKLVPQLSKPQQLPVETENIDKIFNKYYPNIELIIKNMDIKKSPPSLPKRKLKKRTLPIHSRR